MCQSGTFRIRSGLSETNIPQGVLWILILVLSSMSIKICYFAQSLFKSLWSACARLVSMMPVMLLIPVLAQTRLTSQGMEALEALPGSLLALLTSTLSSWWLQGNTTGWPWTKEQETRWPSTSGLKLNFETPS